MECLTVPPMTYISISQRSAQHVVPVLSTQQLIKPSQKYIHAKVTGSMCASLLLASLSSPKSLCSIKSNEGPHCIHYCARYNKCKRVYVIHYVKHVTNELKGIRSIISHWTRHGLDADSERVYALIRWNILLCGTANCMKPQTHFPHRS